MIEEMHGLNIDIKSLWMANKAAEMRIIYSYQFHERRKKKKNRQFMMVSIVFVYLFLIARSKVVSMAIDHNGFESMRVN